MDVPLPGLVGDIEDQVVVGGNQGNKGDFLPLHDLQNLLGPEGSGRVDVDRGADIGEGEGEEGGVDVAKGHDIHAHIPLVEPEVHGVDQEEGDVGFMGAQHPFGFTGGAGGIDEYPCVRRGDRCVRFTVGCLVQQRFVFLVARFGLVHHNVVLR